MPAVTESPSATTDQGFGGLDGVGAGLGASREALPKVDLGELLGRDSGTAGGRDGLAFGVELTRPAFNRASPRSRGADGSIITTAQTVTRVSARPEQSSNQRRRDGVTCAGRVEAVRCRCASGSGGSGGGDIGHQRATGSVSRSRRREGRALT
jgi:hypothetical protein